MRRVAPQRTVFLRKLIAVRMWRPVNSQNNANSLFLQQHLIPTSRWVATRHTQDDCTTTLR